MAENKKSFIAYCDWVELFNALSNEDAGKLAKHLFNYVNDLNPKSDKQTELLFISIKQSLKRDLKKYEDYVDKQRVNGKKGGRPKKTQKTQAFLEKPKKADSDSVSDSDNVNDIPNIDIFISYCLSKKSNICKESIKLKYESWVENGWKDGNNKPIKNWKSKALNVIPYLKEVDKVKLDSYGRIKGGAIQ